MKYIEDMFSLDYKSGYEAARSIIDSNGKDYADYEIKRFNPLVKPNDWQKGFIDAVNEYEPL